MSKACARCGRTYIHVREVRGEGCARCVETVYVRHAYYGCDSGCDGHEVVGLDSRGNEVYCSFEFDRPYDDDPETWARSLADAHCRGAKFDALRSTISEW